MVDEPIFDSAPRKLSRFEITYKPTHEWSLSGSWRYVGRYAMNEANTHFYDGHNLIDLGVSWSADDRLSLDVTVENALERAYARRADFAFGNVRYFPGDPRRLSVRLKRYY